MEIKKDHLVDIYLKRTYSKNEDIKLLEENGYSEDCAQVYMNGYVDGIEYCLSMISPNINFEAYINAILKNRIENIDIINTGMVIASTNSDVPNNLFLVLSSYQDNSSVYDIVFLIPEISIEGYKFEKRYDINIQGLPEIYPENFSIDLGIIRTIDFKELKNVSFSKLADINVERIVKACNDYNEEMENLYNAIIEKSNAIIEKATENDNK